MEDLGAIFVGDHGKIEIKRGSFTADPTDLLKGAPPETKQGRGESIAHIQNFFDCIRIPQAAQCRRRDRPPRDHALPPGEHLPDHGPQALLGSRRARSSPATTRPTCCSRGPAARDTNCPDRLRLSHASCELGRTSAGVQTVVVPSSETRFAYLNARISIDDRTQDQRDRRVASCSRTRAGWPRPRPWPAWRFRTSTPARTTRSGWPSSAAAAGAPARWATPSRSPASNVKLIAMADLFPDRLDGSHKQLKDQFGPKVDVPPERRFLGFDAYRKAIDCLRPGDVALLTTHAAFRPTHLEYAVEKGVNIFMEKTFAPDPGGVKQVLRAGQAAEAKNLKLAAGLMCRHSVARQAMIQKIRDGAMGPIELIRAYRMGAAIAMGPWKPEESELLWQIRRPYFFHWALLGPVHRDDDPPDRRMLLDQGLAGRSPPSGSAGRTADSTDCSQNLDTYSIEYTFPDGTKAQVVGRYVNRTHNDFATYVHGTKSRGTVLGQHPRGHGAARTRIRGSPATTSPGRPTRRSSIPGRRSGTT